MVFSFWGSGVYTRGGKRFSSSLANAYDTGVISILAIDKPGISFSPEENDFQMDFERFSRFTQDDLLNCAESALRKAAKDLKPREIFFKGHSEGVEILTRLYKKLFLQDRDFASKITKMVFSGISLAGWKAEVKRQFNTMYPKGLREQMYPRFERALNENDNVYLIANGGVSSYYFKNVFDKKPLADEFKDLANMKPDAKFYFFQGDKDKNTPAQFVKKLEKWNFQQPMLKRLKLTVRYYDAGHSLNKKASKDMSQIISGEN